VKPLVCLEEWHGRLVADLCFGAPAVAPLLSHPLRSNAGRHRLEDQEQSAGAAALAVGESPLSARFLHLLERSLDHAVGEARHGGLQKSSRYWGLALERLLGAVCVGNDTLGLST